MNWKITTFKTIERDSWFRLQWHYYLVLFLAVTKIIWFVIPITKICSPTSPQAPILPNREFASASKACSAFVRPNSMAAKMPKQLRVTKANI